jgi:hypothetical protein
LGVFQKAFDIAKFLDDEITTFRDLQPNKTNYCLKKELKEIRKMVKWLKSGKEQMPSFKVLQFCD